MTQILVENMKKVFNAHPVQWTVLTKMAMTFSQRSYFDSVFIFIKLIDSPKGKDEKGVDQFYGLNVGGATRCSHDFVQWTVLTKMAMTFSQRSYFDSVFIFIKLIDSPKGKDEKGVDQFYGLNVGGASTCLHDLLHWTVLTKMAITLSPKKIF